MTRTAPRIKNDSDNGVFPPSTLTVVETERQPAPLLYRADGTPLCQPKRRIGFNANT